MADLGYYVGSYCGRLVSSEYIVLSTGTQAWHLGRVCLVRFSRNP